MKTLLKHSSADAISSPDEQGFTPLLYAALNGAHDIAAALLKVLYHFLKPSGFYFVVLLCSVSLSTLCVVPYPKVDCSCVTY